ncbi:hypothetical protein PGT21_000084 [Puccinia graminis f. sp. tritici]|uniref:Glucanase n=1 Tax=Puccinia graminis f. sp. tritici TaxID=56615 RepID=A0A5B0NR02_PUCGR|nr:hypothetical protein PGT21_000084 [Puccinia graminis f. sp. tritici]
MDLFSLLLLLQSLSSSYAQNAGKIKPEKPVPFIVKECASGSNCKDLSGGLTIDANWRWTHDKDQEGQKCYDGSAWTQACSGTGEECAKKCVIEGAGDYDATYGVKGDGKDGVTLKYVTKNDNGKNAGSRMYFLEQGGEKYHMFKLKNKQFEFDVDVSNLPCGVNGALYFTAMEQDGGKSKNPTNGAGAKYGTGYCDAQCPKDIKWINGKANNKGWKGDGANVGAGDMGVCCPEMDIWEANSFAQAFTSHTCKSLTAAVCTGDQSGKESGYQQEVHSRHPIHYQRHTDDGELIEVRRMYRQNGNLIKNEAVKVKGLDKPADSLTDQFCQANKAATGDHDSFKDRGGMKAMGEAMKNGMVLVLSIGTTQRPRCSGLMVSILQMALLTSMA